MSGGEPSSIKQLTRCAARQPALSREYGYRVAARFDGWCMVLLYSSFYFNLRR